MSEVRILIAINEALLFNDIENQLKDFNYSVIKAPAYASEIVSKATDIIPDLVVISTILENKYAGIDAALKIKDKINCPIIFISSDDTKEAYTKAKSANPIAYFSNPIDIENLIRTIELGITNHKLQEEIVDAHKKYELLLKSSKAGVYEINPSTFEINGDEILAEVFGYTMSEVREKGWGNLMPIDDFNKKKLLLSDLLQNKIDSYFIEHRVIKKDNSLAWAQSSGSLVKNGHGKIKIVGTLTDITKRKIAEEKLIEYSEELKKSNAAKDKFFSIISHDLRNPFNSLLGFSELLANNIEDLTEQEIKDSAKTLNRTANNLFSLLTNLLEWSRLQTGNFTIEKIDFSLSIIINYIIDVFSNSISEKELNVTKENDCSINVYADRNMIEAAIRNVISNSIKFTRKGGAISIICQKNNSFAEIIVKDNGIGISIEDQARLFKIDKQFSTEGTNYEKGTGFGLLLAKEMIEKNGGSIKFFSEKGKGSTFTITLPIQA